MPRKATPSAQRMTPAQRRRAEEREHLAKAVAEEMKAAIKAVEKRKLSEPGMTKKKLKKQRAAESREFKRELAEYRAEWEALSPKKREKWKARVYADVRKYDMYAIEPTDDEMPTYYWIHKSADRHEKANPIPRQKTYAEYEAEIQARRAAREASVAAPAPVAPAPTEEPTEKPKRRRRGPLGFTGYVDPATGKRIDPRLVDEWSDFEEDDR